MDKTEIAVHKRSTSQRKRRRKQRRMRLTPASVFLLATVILLAGFTLNRERDADSPIRDIAAPDGQIQILSSQTPSQPRIISASGEDDLQTVATPLTVAQLQPSSQPQTISTPSSEDGLQTAATPLTVTQLQPSSQAQTISTSSSEDGLQAAATSLIVAQLQPSSQAQTISIPSGEDDPQTTATPSTVTQPQTSRQPITSDSWKLILVNPWNSLPEGYSIETVTLKNGLKVDKRCYPDLQAMMDACRADGLSPVICSAYRTQKNQERLFQNKVNRLIAQGYSETDAPTEAGKSVSVPGTSEHQLGLAVDIVDVNNQLLNETQERTKVQKWLMEHSWEYGFILRYPNDKSETTGIIYEPWHYRYVGREDAEQIHSLGICLEEYLEGTF